MKKLWVGTILMAGLIMFPVMSMAGGRPVGSWFPISPQDTYNWYHEKNPAVAYNNQRQEYLVVWNGSDDLPYIYGQRVSRNGDLIGSAFLISQTAGAVSHADVAYNPDRNEYLVVYQSEDTNSGIFGMRINANGGAVHEERIIAYDPDFSHRYPAVAYSPDTDNYLVTWQKEQGSYRGIEVRTLAGDDTVTTMGDKLQVTGMILGAQPSFPDVACNRSNDECLVVWQQRFNSTAEDNDVKGQRIHMVAGIDDTRLEGLNFSILATTSDEISPAVAAVPLPSGVSVYLVVSEYWDDVSAGRRIGGQLMTDTGYFIDAFLILSPEMGTYPAVAGSESTGEFLVAWKYGLNNIQARAITLRSTTECTIGPSSLLTGSGYPESPGIAAGPRGDYLVACHDAYTGDSPIEIYGHLWGTTAHQRSITPVLNLLLGD